MRIATPASDVVESSSETSSTHEEVSLVVASGRRSPPLWPRGGDSTRLRSGHTTIEVWSSGEGEMVSYVAERWAVVDVKREIKKVWRIFWNL